LRIFDGVAMYAGCPAVAAVMRTALGDADEARGFLHGKQAEEQAIDESDDAALAPMPSASEIIATPANIGDLINARNA